MIVLNVTYRCKPDRREAFLERILAEGIDAASRAEAGNLQYGYFLPFEDDGSLLLVEKWRDADALDAHAKTPHYAALKEIKSEYVTETVIERFELPE